MLINFDRAPMRRALADKANKTAVTVRGFSLTGWRRCLREALAYAGMARMAGGAVAIAATATLVACGGGGDSGNSGGSGSSLAAAPAVGNIALAANVVPITVDSGVSGAINVPNVSITLCAPGTTNCQTIDHVLVDTGSIGLRLTSVSAAQVLGALPIAAAPAGGQLAECYQYADGYAWGTVRTADVKIGGEIASNTAVQIIGDLPQSTVPASDCVNGPAEDTPEQVGSNGILGIGPASADCGIYCMNLASTDYYACPNGQNCTTTVLPAVQQVTNPVTLFPVDNNGVIVQMPALAPSGATTASGVLAFGIGTQSNNALGSNVTSYKTTNFGGLTGNYKGATKVAFFDTGSNGYFFTDSSLPACNTSSVFYCPTALTSLSATITAVDGKSGVVNFNVDSILRLTASGNKYAFDNVGGNFGDATQLDFGLPFFYGKSFYVGYASGQADPYVAF